MQQITLFYTEKKMKTSKVRTIWIIIASAFYTAFICSRAIIRRFLGKINRKWVDKTMHEWVDVILNLIRVDYKVVNPHHVKPREGVPTIIMCNHSSLYDIPLSLKAFPDHSIRMLAKKELAKIPFMGKGMKAAEFPFIDRKNRAQAIKDLERVRELMQSGIVMWIAPEGTRSKDGTLGSFKKGGFITAIRAGATIIPMGIRGAYDILPARTYQLHINQKAEVHIGKPIDASQYNLENKEALIAETRETIRTLCGESCTS